MKNWSPPADWLRIRTIDAHTCGEPFRIITGGMPDVKGKTVLERRRYAKENLDHIRKALMLEPRGHPDMYGCIITPPDRRDSSLGVLFLHNEGYSTMCGHGIIALATVMTETVWNTFENDGKNGLPLKLFQIVLLPMSCSVWLL